MLKKKKNVLLALPILAILAWLINDIITQKSAADLKGGFTEIATYRNENNTGPIQRIYIISVKDTANAALEAYGNFMPHSKYGNTKVYFFKAGTEVPTQLFPGKLNFDSSYNKNCFAVYEKTAMGNYNTVLNPFKQK